MSEGLKHRRVLYWNDTPSPYVVERFNEIERQGRLDFEAWFGFRETPERSWEIDERDWRFKFRYVPATLRSRTTLTELGSLVRRPPDALVTLHHRPAYIAAMALAKARGYPVGVRALRVYDTWREPSPIKDRAKGMVFPRLDFVQVPGQDAADYVQRFGADSARIWSFPEPVDSDHFSRGDRAELRGQLITQLGLSEPDAFLFLYVGRVWRGKGLDVLVEAFDELSQRNEHVGLILVGDGVDEEHYRTRLGTLSHAKLFPFVQRDALPTWYAACDAFVFPTLGDPYGQVIQEAMAAGLPVIASSAAGDIRDRVTPGETGLIVPVGDPSELAGAMRSLLIRPALAREMGGRGAQRMKERTVSNWAARFADMIGEVTVGYRSGGRWPW